ncbi:uncharacterized protein TNCV_2414381 [Trichonephila clavipes]|nr:uncharacterized protein TNCV_2414381 [Trichonephila clavipes]
MGAVQCSGNDITVLTYEELLTFLCNCKSIVNSRPLYVYEESDDLVPLTPVMFMNRVDLEVIVEAFAQLCCPKYFAEKVELFEDSRYGLCSNLTLKFKCSDFFCICFIKKSCRAPVINTRPVYDMRQIGKGFAGAFKLFSTLNLPRLTKTAYKNQDAKLLKVVQEVAEESMIKAATEIVEKKQNLSSDIVKCGISVDGT